jgi:hypothetical protein
MTENKPEYASPACFLNEADDVYSGYAPRSEIVAFLNELLEAERAGSRVTLESAREAGAGPMSDLLAAIQHDEAKWCAMLLGHVKAQGAEPTPNIGAFYGKAMAIADMGERIRFLNRGQGWVVKRIEPMLARVRDDKLHADLKEMLDSHEVNIALAKDVASPKEV